MTGVLELDDPTYRSIIPSYEFMNSCWSGAPVSGPVDYTEKEFVFPNEKRDVLPPIPAFCESQRTSEATCPEENMAKYRKTARMGDVAIEESRQKPENIPKSYREVTAGLVVFVFLCAVSAFSGVKTETPLAIAEEAVLQASSADPDPPNGGWLLDPLPADIDSEACGVDRVHAKALTQALFDERYVLALRLTRASILCFPARELKCPRPCRYSGKRPVIIDGLLDHWPARRRWRKRDLVAFLGQRPIAAGDGANIVQSGGRVRAGFPALSASAICGD
jgi:hypothetical protein